MVLQQKILLIRLMYISSFVVFWFGSIINGAVSESLEKKTLVGPNPSDFKSGTSVKGEELGENETCYDSNSGSEMCPLNLHFSCSELGGDCVDCIFNCTCIYGKEVKINCTAKTAVDCIGPRTFERQIICRYCYQTLAWEHTCSGFEQCKQKKGPWEMFRANCTVHSEVTCMGRRSFPKMMSCNWTSGYRWSTALFLSVTLGGFGADRFYLGHWQEGIGKLFSFGGLGVWTLVDVVLIFVRYLGPADGSLYIG